MYYYMKQIIPYNHNHSDDILRIFDILPDFPLTTSETKHDS